MDKRRKTMCATCIYRTGELTRNIRKHPCHEHSLGDINDESVACAGSCKADGMNLVTGKTPNGERWGRSMGLHAISEAIESMIRKGFGKPKMSDSVRLYKISGGKINHII